MQVFICWSGELSYKVAQAMTWLIKETFKKGEIIPC